jgi:phage shock protein PspC (stress-responsive transcriptional regulator)
MPYDSDNEPGRGGKRATGSDGSSELQKAVDRFEEAISDLVGSATNEFSDRATSFLNETTARIERELGSLTGRRDDDGRSDSAARMAARRRARARYRSQRVLERSPRLCRDDENAKIVGVCAGLANYYGVEAWVVRCIAVTGLLFFGSIVFPAYWIMYFVMEDPKKSDKREKSKGRRARRSSRSESFIQEPPREETCETCRRTCRKWSCGCAGWKRM